MDTKWKKLKAAISFLVFFSGMTLFINNLIVAAGLAVRSGGDVLRGETDYQTKEEFRWYISDRLEELLSAATGGEVVYSAGGAVENIAQVTVTEDIVTNDRGYLRRGTATLTQEAEEVYEREYEAAEYRGEYWEEKYREQTLAKYMADMAQDKNLLYAVVYQGKLLYSNMESFENKEKEAWDGADFNEALSSDDYNFTLWFNKDGDGKVQIIKDGREEDVYGDGIYRETSRWFVPGYNNFKVDTSTNDAVIFLAAAKEPSLYVAGNYSEYGSVWYHGQLYYMYQGMIEEEKQFNNSCILLLAAVFLLVLSFIFRKDKRLADQAVARFMQKIWLEFKVLIWVIIPVAAFFYTGRWQIRELTAMLRYGMWEEYGYVGTSYWDMVYYLKTIVVNSAFLTTCFWVIYLIILDFRCNKDQQKKPIVDGLQTKRLHYSVQKKLIKRYRLTWIMGCILILCCLALIVALNVMGYDYLDYDTWNLWKAVSAVIVILLLIYFGVGIINLRKNHQLAKDIGVLTDRIKEVREGNLVTSLELSEDADLMEAAENLNEIQHGMEAAIHEQMQSERMKVELVTNVSHDIKTPLTSIISYVELLKQEEGLPDHVMEFIQILSEKSERLKNIVQDVFEVSKAASGQLLVNMEDLDLGKLLRQTLADMDTQIEMSGLTMKTSIPEEPVMIRADGQRLYRVFQNLIQNALKYSLQGSRIFLTLADSEETSVVCIKNISGMELNDTIDFAERFVRGDASRTDGGSGLGLSIAKSFTEACGGSLQIEVNADLFTVTVSFQNKRVLY